MQHWNMKTVPSSLWHTVYNKTYMIGFTVFSLDAQDFDSVASKWIVIGSI